MYQRVQGRFISLVLSTGGSICQQHDNSQGCESQFVWRPFYLVESFAKPERVNDQNPTDLNDATLDNDDSKATMAVDARMAPNPKPIGDLSGCHVGHRSCHDGEDARRQLDNAPKQWNPQF